MENVWANNRLSELFEVLTLYGLSSVEDHKTDIRIYEYREMGHYLQFIREFKKKQQEFLGITKRSHWNEKTDARFPG